MRGLEDLIKGTRMSGLVSGVKHMISHLFHV